MGALIRWATTVFVLGALGLFASTTPAQAQTDAELAAEWQLAFQFHDLIAPLPTDGNVADTRVVTIDIDAPIGRTFAAFTDVRNAIGKHSFLKHVAVHREWQTSSARHVNFTGVEVIPVGGIPVTSNTHAMQTIYPSTHTYDISTWSLPNIVTRQHVVFIDLGNGSTRVTEHLTFEALPPLLDFTVQNGVAAHVEDQQGLKQALESGVL